MFKLVHGNEQFLSLRSAHMAIEALKRDFPEFETTVIDCETESSEKIVSCYQTDDMFSKGKNLLIKRLLNHKQKDEIIPNLLEQIKKSEEKNNIILWEDHKVNSITKYFKFFNLEKAVETFETLNKRSFVTWAKQEMLSFGMAIDTSTLYSLSQRTDYRTERFVNEMQKFRLLGASTITDEMITQISADTLEYDIWKFLDLVNSTENKPEAFTILTKLGKEYSDPNYLLSMLTRNIRLIILIKYLTEKGNSSADISKQLRIPPFTIPSLLKTSTEYSYSKLKQIYSKLFNLDYEIKTGNIDGDLGITLLMTIL